MASKSTLAYETLLRENWDIEGVQRRMGNEYKRLGLKYDGMEDSEFAEVVRKEIGKTLGIVRHRAVEKAKRSGAGSAASAVLRRQYKNRLGGNINIAGNRRRISSRERVVPEPTGGRSGIRRPRTVSDRTKQLRKYFGPDRGFILRMLEAGTDVRYAEPSGPTGKHSQATYGRRGSIAPRSFFHSMHADMEQAAEQLGQTLMGWVEKFIEQQDQEIKN